MGPDVLVCHRCGYVPPDPEGETFCPKDGLNLVARSEHDKSPRDVFLGTTIGGRYPVLGLLGRGGMGAVYRSVQPLVEREVAIKVILPFDGSEADVARQRFLREAKAIAGVAHPSIVTLYDFGVEEDGTLYMVMERVRGRTLREAQRSGSLPAGAFVDVCIELLGALDVAHAGGLVHRDLKPDNVMLLDEPTEHNHIKVLDFGLARLAEGTVAGGASRRPAPCSGRRSTCRPSKRAAGTSTPAPICTRWA